MLNFTVLKSSTDLKNYYKPDYFLENSETRAFFGGKLAEHLGLDEFDVHQFHDLCDGVVPGSRSEQKPKGVKLTVGRKDGSRAGWDITVDGPKDLGVLMALGLDDRIVPDILERAARDVAAEIERDAKTRIRVGRQSADRVTGNIAYTGILHLTSRPVGDSIDIQPHIHLLVHNATWDAEEGKMKALQLQDFGANGSRIDRPYYSAFLTAKLAQYAQEAGYEIAPDRKTGSFKIVGVPDRVRREFSQRTAKIEAVAAQLEQQKQEFLGDPTAKLNPAVKGRLGAHTRERKQPGRTWESLLRHWQSRLLPGELQAINATVASALEAPMAVEDRSRESVDWALAHLLERKSVVAERAVVMEALKHGLGAVTPEDVWKELHTRKDVIRSQVGGQMMVSTQGVLGEEQAITAFAVKGRGRFRPLCSLELAGTLEKLRVGIEPTDPSLSRPRNDLITNGTTSLASPGVNQPPSLATSGSDFATASAFGQAVSAPVKSRAASVASSKNSPESGQVGAYPQLSPSQQAAIRHVWTSRDRLILIRGAAGTGKTTLTKAALAGVNVTWVILAPSAEASRGVLRRDGFSQADTLARFLVDEEFQEKARNGLIWLDEASLAGARDVAKLTQLADSLNARIVLSGDRRQHKSVARGDVLALLEDRAGLPVAEVSEIKRQSGAYKEAVAALAAGDVADGFARLDALGWVKEVSYAAEAAARLADTHVGEFPVMHEQLAADYLAAVRDGKSVLVVSPTHQEGEAVTAAIRAKLKEDGRLKGEERTFERLVPLHLTEAQRSEYVVDRDGIVAQLLRSQGDHRPGDRIALNPGRVCGDDRLRASGIALFESAAIRLAPGDAVRVTANGKTLDGEHRLNNGASYTVTGFTDKGDIRLDNGWTISKDFGHLAHGYVATSHAAQGKTVDIALVAMGNQSLPAMGSEQFYVSASRARQRTTIYVESREAVREAIARDDKRLLASDLVPAPPKKFRQRLKLHAQSLRQAASRAMGRNLQLEQETQRGYGYE